MEKIHLKEYVKILSRKLMSQFACSDEVKVLPASIEKVKFNQCTTAIHLNGEGLQIAFFLHFMYKKASGLANNRFELKVDELTQAQLVDSLKEFCNLVGGHLAHIFNKMPVEVHYGLPFSIQGFNQIIIMDAQKEFEDTIFWRLGTEEYFVDCSMRYCTDKKEIADLISQLDVNSQLLEENQEIEKF